MQRELSDVRRGSVELRPIRRSDDARVAWLIRNVLHEFGLDDGADSEADRMYDSYTAPGAAYIVATVDGEVIGGGGIGPLRSAPGEVCELRKMYLLPEARGRGLGRRLLQSCLAAARGAGYRRCYLETAPVLEQAIALYRAFGFRPRAERLGDAGHRGCQLYYELSLSPAGVSPSD